MSAPNSYSANLAARPAELQKKSLDSLMDAKKYEEYLQTL